MASKKNTPKKSTSTATKTSTRTKAPARVANETTATRIAADKDADTATRNRRAAAARVSKRDAANTEFESLQTEQVAAIAAGPEALREHLSSDVKNRTSRVAEALADRQADVKDMANEFEDRREVRRSRKEDLRAGRLMAAPERVPVAPDDGRPTPSGISPDVTSSTVVPVGNAVDHLPGTGVADPKDLAPGQSLEPSPPGGVAIAPQPDKPGTNYSKL